MKLRYEIGDMDWLEAYYEDKERWAHSLIEAEYRKAVAAEPSPDAFRVDLWAWAASEVAYRATNDAFDREMERRNKEAAWDRACEAVGPYLLGRVQ